MEKPGLTLVQPGLSMTLKSMIIGFPIIDTDITGGYQYLRVLYTTRILNKSYQQLHVDTPLLREPTKQLPLPLPYCIGKVVSNTNEPPKAFLIYLILKGV